MNFHCYDPIPLILAPCLDPTYIYNCQKYAITKLFFFCAQLFVKNIYNFASSA